MRNAQSVVDCADHVRELDRHQRAGSQVLGAGRVRACGIMLEPMKGAEQLFQASGEQHLLETRIGARPRDVCLGDHRVIHDPSSKDETLLSTASQLKVV